MSGTSSMIRKLGPFERFFLDMSRNRSTHFVMAFEVDGIVNPDAWRSALRAVEARHPLLSSVIRIGEDGTPEFGRVHDAPIPIRVVDDANAHWTREAEAELATPFATEQPPLVRTVLMRHGPRSVVVIVALHAVADGRSIEAVFRDALASMAGQTLPRHETVPSREDLVANLRAEDGPPPAPPSGGEPNRYAAPGAAPSVASLCLAADLAAGLRERAREEGTSLHGALCAAVVLAGQKCSEAWRGRAVRVDSPIDIRKQLGAGDECVPLLAPGKAVCDAGRHPAFWELARSARTQTMAGASAGAVRAGAAGLAQFYAGRPDVAAVAELAAGAFGCDAIVTNLGAWPYPTQFGDLRLEIVHGPALLMGFAGVETVGAATCDGRLCLTHASFTPIPSLLHGIEDVLRGSCASGRTAER